MKSRLSLIVVLLITLALLGLVAIIGNLDQVQELAPSLALVAPPDTPPDSLFVETPPDMRGDGTDAAQLRRYITIRAAQWYGKAPYTWGGIKSDAPGAGYRLDCSGFVSYAWELPQPGPVTGEFVSKGYAARIGVKDLETGDALNNERYGADGHMVLFWEWEGQNRSHFWALEMSGRFTDGASNYNAVLNLYRVEACTADGSGCKIQRVYNWNQRQVLDFTDGTTYYAERLKSIEQVSASSANLGR